MDRTRNALMDYTTADVLNTPIRRGGVLPLTEYANRTEFDPSSGLLGALGQAVTAPARAWRGEIDDSQMIPEGMNLAGFLALGGAAAPKAVTGPGLKNHLMSAYKAMGPEDAPADAMRTARLAGANRFIFDRPDGMEATAFANRSPSTLTGDELLDMLYGSGMGPANSNKATAELFSNGKNSAVPGLAMSEAAQSAKSHGGGGIKAFHGSPHNFDRFSMDKIGTGEGAQAYGHGLYFAENEGVAKEYRARLSGDVTTMDNINSADRIARSLMTYAGGDKSLAEMSAVKKIAEIRAMPAYTSPATPEIGFYTKSQLEAYTTALDRIRSGEVKPDGHMYEVRINADPNDFLDWDRPLSQQSEKVRGALSTAYADDPVRSADIAYGNGSSIPAYIMRNAHGPEVSKTLREAGIPGIRYLDQGSRGAGEGSSNYVVFDDALIEIMRKYGLLGPAVGLGAASLLANDDGLVY